jgi:1,4-dihydroxy-2-naphthoyl-CoA hydrolase
MKDANFFNDLGKNGLPGHLGIRILDLSKNELTAELKILPMHMAANGFLHAGTVVTLADTSAGYGCVNNLPEGSNGFTTIELKSNHLGTARDGSIVCTATMAHSGRTTQVWDAVVRHFETNKTIAIFRCTQMILYPKK